MIEVLSISHNQFLGRKPILTIIEWFVVDCLCLWPLLLYELLSILGKGWQCVANLSSDNY